MRFPEFSGVWEKYALGQLGETIIGLTYSPSDVVSKDGVIVFRSSNIKNGRLDYNDIVRVSKKIKDCLYTQVDDILICARNGSARLIGKNAILGESDLGHTFGAFMMTYRSSQNRFIHHLLHTKRYFSQVGENLGARINQITTSDFNSFEFYFPKNNEAIKIAKFVDLLDERIATQSRIIEDLEQLKSAISKKLISHKARIAKIGSICSIAKQIKVDVPEYDRIITVRLHCKGVCRSSANNLELGATQYYVRQKGQLIWGKQNFHHGAIGIVPDDFDGGLTSKDIPSFDIDTNSCCPKFILYQLQMPCYYQAAEAYMTGTGSKRLKEETFLNMEVALPPLSEQREIVGTIEAVEKKLNVEIALLGAYMQQKQYLLQQMFI